MNTLWTLNILSPRLASQHLHCAVAMSVIGFGIWVKVSHDAYLNICRCMSPVKFMRQVLPQKFQSVPATYIALAPVQVWDTIFKLQQLCLQTSKVKVMRPTKISSEWSCLQDRMLMLLYALTHTGQVPRICLGILWQRNETTAQEIEGAITFAIITMIFMLLNTIGQQRTFAFRRRMGPLRRMCCIWGQVHLSRPLGNCPRFSWE